MRNDHDQRLIDVDNTSFAKGKDGNWQIKGPSRHLRQAMDGKPAVVDVTLKSGKIKPVMVYGCSSDFVVDGESYCFGFLTKGTQ